MPDTLKLCTRKENLLANKWKYNAVENSATRTDLHLWNMKRRRKRRSQRFPRDIFSSLELQQQTKGPVEISLGDFLSRNSRRITMPIIKEHRVHPSLEWLHPTLKKCADDIHTVDLLLRNQLEILHSMVESFYLRYLAIQDLVFLGPLRLDYLGGVERSKTKMMPSHCGVANIKPSPPPVLDRFGHGKGKEKQIGFEGNDATPNGIHTIRTRLPLHGIEFPEEDKVRLDTKPALAESDKTSNVKKRIGGKMMQLDTVKKEQSTKEVVDWEGKSVNNEGEEHNPKPSGGTGDYLIAVSSPARKACGDHSPASPIAASHR